MLKSVVKTGGLAITQICSQKHELPAQLFARQRISRKSLECLAFAHVLPATGEINGYPGVFRRRARRLDYANFNLFGCIPNFWVCYSARIKRRGIGGIAEQCQRNAKRHAVLPLRYIRGFQNIVMRRENTMPLHQNMSHVRSAKTMFFHQVPDRVHGAVRVHVTRKTLD